MMKKEDEEPQLGKSHRSFWKQSANSSTVLYRDGPASNFRHFHFKNLFFYVFKLINFLYSFIKFGTTYSITAL